MFTHQTLTVGLGISPSLLVLQAIDLLEAPAGYMIVPKSVS